MSGYDVYPYDMFVNEMNSAIRMAWVQQGMIGTIPTFIFDQVKNKFKKLINENEKQI